MAGPLRILQQRQIENGFGLSRSSGTWSLQLTYDSQPAALNLKAPSMGS